MKRLEKGFAVFFGRTSSVNQPTSLRDDIDRASYRAAQMNITFRGDPDEIDLMIESGSPICGDIFLDHGITGSHLGAASRSLYERCRMDLTVSHLFVPCRDRIARHVHGGRILEAKLRRLGITLVNTEEVGDSEKQRWEHVSEMVSALFRGPKRKAPFDKQV